jgi:hypothetical protein
MTENSSLEAPKLQLAVNLRNCSRADRRQAAAKIVLAYALYQHIGRMGGAESDGFEEFCYFQN